MPGQGTTQGQAGARALNCHRGQELPLFLAGDEE
jgi:hypothetical protein